MGHWFVENLPVLDPEQRYHVWLIQNMMGVTERPSAIWLKRNGRESLQIYKPF
jgi:hypothetical protein